MKITTRLLKEDDFISKTINKEKFFINEKYGITLKKLPKKYAYTEYLNLSEDLIIKKKNEIIDDSSEVSILITKSKFKIDAKLFKDGLPEINLSQGNFNSAYKENIQNIECVIKRDKAKILCEALFNNLISSPLMLSNSEPNYNYNIIECNFEYLYQNVIKMVRFSYHFKDMSVGGRHDFWMTRELYDLDSFVHGIQHSMLTCLTIDDIITNFIK